MLKGTRTCCLWSSTTQLATRGTTWPYCLWSSTTKLTTRGTTWPCNQCVGHRWATLTLFDTSLHIISNVSSLNITCTISVWRVFMSYDKQLFDKLEHIMAQSRYHSCLTSTWHVPARLDTMLMSNNSLSYSHYPIKIQRFLVFALIGIFNLEETNPNEVNVRDKESK